MKKHKWIFLTFGFLLFMIFLVGYGFVKDGRDQEKIFNVSVLLYGNDTERWISLKQGMEQASKDYNIIFNYITTSEEYAPGEQIQQIKREIENGAQGLLIAASNSTMLEEAVVGLAHKIPVVMIETGINDVETVGYLSADNYGMGKALAETIIKDGVAKKKVAVISEHMKRDSVRKRKEGFTDNLKGYDVAYWKKSDVKLKLSDQKADAVVALDNSTLKDLADAITAVHPAVTLYGIGNTDKVVYGLDKEVIKAIVFQDEFSIGYLGGQRIYQRMEGISTEKVPQITFRVINKQNMYTNQNQRLLFPLVQ